MKGRARLVVVSALLAGVGCVDAITLSPEVALRDRLCDAVVASYRVGLRPAEVHVTIPGANAGDPPLGLTFAGNQMPLAEQCLGLAVPTIAQAPMAQSAPTAPSSPPASTGSPPPAPSASALPPALPPAPTAPSARPSPPRPRNPNPLDTRT